MPLLLCPNDNSSMQTVDRAGVQFDMCPACRGVWLDRGELEKLMAGDDPSGRQPQGHAPRAPQPPAQPWSAGYGDRGERGDHDERGKYGHRSRRPSIFDIFD